MQILVIRNENNDFSSLFSSKVACGTEIAAYNIAKYTAKNGHEVNVVTSYDEGLSKKSIEEGFTVYRIPRSEIRIISVLIFWLKIFIAIWKINPEIIHVQGLSISMPAIFIKKNIKDTLYNFRTGI